jgi:DNA-binding NtrC family response regulator
VLLSSHHYTGNVRELRSLLLRALFFRRKRQIGEEDVRAVMATLGPREKAAAERLTIEVAQEIFDGIRRGDRDFWSGVHTPFSENRISREVVAAVVELARQQGAGTMPKIAQLLCACEADNGNNEARKVFFKFKNFLYKTIRIG